MEQYWPYVIKTLAVLVAAGHGWFLATVPADWRQNTWGESEPDFSDSPLEELDPTGIAGGWT